MNLIEEMKNIKYPIFLHRCQNYRKRYTLLEEGQMEIKESKKYLMKPALSHLTQVFYVRKIGRGGAASIKESESTIGMMNYLCQNPLLGFLGMNLLTSLFGKKPEKDGPIFLFKYRPGWHRNPERCNLRYGWLRGNMSIAGCAIQFAFYGGAKKIVLCGVDMYGRVR